MPETLPAIKLANYDGPLDLLLELARGRKLDLTTVSLREMTASFLDYLKNNIILPQLLGDFLVVASTLLLLKIQHLLPRQVETEPAVQQLTDRLRIYQLYRDQAQAIRPNWDRNVLRSRGAFDDQRNLGPEHAMPSITAGDLAIYVQQLIDRLPKPPQPTRYTPARGRSLQECLLVFQARLAQYSQFVFQDEIATANRYTAAVSFLAVLELARQRHVTLGQEERCGMLTIFRSL